MHRSQHAPIRLSQTEGSSAVRRKLHTLTATNMRDGCASIKRDIFRWCYGFLIGAQEADAESTKISICFDFFHHHLGAVLL